MANRNRKRKLIYTPSDVQYLTLQDVADSASSVVEELVSGRVIHRDEAVVPQPETPSKRTRIQASTYEHFTARYDTDDVNYDVALAEAEVVPLISRAKRYASSVSLRTLL